MVVVDNGNTFKSVFADMCILMKLRFRVIARNNHQSLCIERFHVYLKKILTITTIDHDSITGVYTPASTITAFTWNIAPIDGTYIVRSVPAMGR
jgi:aspartate aminotransferase-like enzyme